MNASGRLKDSDYYEILRNEFYEMPDQRFSDIPIRPAFSCEEDILLTIKALRSQHEAVNPGFVKKLSAAQEGSFIIDPYDSYSGIHINFDDFDKEFNSNLEKFDDEHKRKIAQELWLYQLNILVACGELLSDNQDPLTQVAQSLTGSQQALLAKTKRPDDEKKFRNGERVINIQIGRAHDGENVIEKETGYLKLYNSAEAHGSKTKMLDHEELLYIGCLLRAGGLIAPNIALGVLGNLLSVMNDCKYFGAKASQPLKQNIDIMTQGVTVGKLKSLYEKLERIHQEAADYREKVEILKNLVEEHAPFMATFDKWSPDEISSKNKKLNNSLVPVLAYFKTQITTKQA